MKSFRITITKANAIRRAKAFHVIGFQLNHKGSKRLALKDCDNAELIQALELGYIKAINLLTWAGATWYQVSYKSGSGVINERLSR